MSQVMLVSMVTNGTQVIVWAFRTFPSDSVNGLHSAEVTHSPIMLNTYSTKKEIIYETLYQV